MMDADNTFNAGPGAKAPRRFTETELECPMVEAVRAGAQSADPAP